MANGLIKKEKCTECGYDKHKGSLHIHHKDFDKTNNVVDNLKVLCANCHMELHHNTTTKIKRNANKCKTIIYLNKKEPPVNYYEMGIQQLEKEVWKESVKLELLNDILDYKKSLRPPMSNIFMFGDMSPDFITVEMQREFTKHVPMR